MADQTVVQKVAQQIKDLGAETVEELKKQPGEIADIALEQTGLKSTPSETNNKQIQQLKAQDKAQSEKLAGQLKKELEVEISRSRQTRQQQLQQRRQDKEADTVKQPEKTETIQTPTSKKARGSVFRVKKAQSQAQPETVGRRVGG